ncbi:MAG: ATP-dependent 6-phosphofructokinase [Sedimentisphaerales bacterium]|nr:ATP-dependent 6-phosphofructokinase [Sedimentisphaerales bacterium]
MAKSRKSIKTIGIMTGGGDCPGLNAVVRAVTKTAINEHHLSVVAIYDGFLGLIEKRMQTLQWEDVSNILTQGGTILGTSNKANPMKYPVRIQGRDVIMDVRDQCVQNAAEVGIDAIIAIGGDGTMSGAAGLVEKGIPFMGVPKTIDNDLWGTEVTFGFNTAVVTATDALDKVHTTASSHHRVMIVEVMGRYAGWIALHAGVASGSDLILIPEIPYTLSSVCDCVVKRSRHGKRFSIITVAEGAKEKGGKMTVSRRIKNSPDPIRLGGIANKLAFDIEKKTKLECRSVILGHVQRGGPPSAFDRTLATSFGYYAIEQLMAGKRNRLVVRKRGELSTVPLSEVANKIRTIDPNHSLIQAARAVGTCFGDE